MDFYSPAYDLAALEILRQEFFSSLNVKEYYQKMEKDLAFNAREVVTGLSPKGATIHTLKNGSWITGVLLLKYYRWDLIAPQLYFKIAQNRGRPIGLSLSPLKDLVGSNQIQVVGELAYYCVNEDRRGQGYGAILFEKALSQFRQHLAPTDLAITLAKGHLAQSRTPGILKCMMLENEERVNGIDPETKLIRVKGEVLTFEDLKTIGLKLEELKTRDLSFATDVLARKYGLNLLGFSSNLSPLFANTLDQLHS